MKDREGALTASANLERSLRSNIIGENGYQGTKVSSTGRVREGLDVALFDFPSGAIKKGVPR